MSRSEEWTSWSSIPTTPTGTLVWGAWRWVTLSGLWETSRTVVDSSNLYVQTPESNDLALLKLKRPMEESDYVKVRLFRSCLDKTRFVV